MLHHTNLPYNKGTMVVLLPPRFKVLQIKLYKKSRGLIDHLKNFKARMTLHDFVEETVCQKLPLTLKVIGRKWFREL